MKIRPYHLLQILAVGISFMGAAASAQNKAPQVLTEYLVPNEIAKGEVVAVIPPEEIQSYIEKVKEASKGDPKWFAEYSAKATPGIPLPFHDKLGLTKEEYAQYIELWDQRDFKVIQEVAVRLEKLGDQWMVRVGGVGARISLLRFDPATETFKSPNGKMERIEDIKADPASILRAWTGQEWKYEKKGALGVTKENFAIGKTEDGKFGLLVYRLQDIGVDGRSLYDQSVLIRFALPKQGDKQ
ncbi:MAG: hypothetical protein ACON5H_01415 [Akkermansiaceae bacterium]